MCVIGEDLESLSATLGLLWRVSSRLLTMSAVRNLKKPCAIELKLVMFCLGLYLIETVLYSFITRVIVYCMKRNVEK